MRGNASRKVLDYACGDPFYNIKKEQREEYQRVHGLDRAIGETMQNLKLYPRLRQNIVNKLGNFTANRETDMAQKGFDGAKRSRMLIRQYNQKQRQNEMNMLKRIIQNEPYACKANNLELMLKRGWTELPNSYRLQSEISQKDETRIKGVLEQNRYNNKCVD